MGVYIGVNNIAKKVKSIYIGVNDVAKKVKGGYIGVNNIAHSFLSSGPDVTKTEYTEAEINELAAYGLINKIPIDSKVTIGNTQDTNRTVHTYRVIGKDHQDLNITNYGSTGTVETGTAPAIGTVDLWATGGIRSQQYLTTKIHYQFSSSTYKQYHTSDMYNWLNGDYYNGFSEITRTHMKTMVVESANLTPEQNFYNTKPDIKTNDAVKLLSFCELRSISVPKDPIDGYNSWNVREGNGYEYFSSVPYDDTSDNATKRYASETDTFSEILYQWLRTSQRSDRSTRIYTSVYSSGAIGLSIPTQSGNYNYLFETRTGTLVPCFRLGPT